MAMEKFLIAPINSGLQTNLKPFLIPDDAYAELNNAYVFRGRVRKRFGSRFMGTGWTSLQTEQLYSRLRLSLGSTDGMGDISGTVPGSKYEVGQLFSIGDEIFTVVTLSNGGGPQDMLKTGSATVATYDTDTGAFDIQGADATTIAYFYPAQPVMGLTNYDTGSINNQPSYAFDTQFAYVFAGGFWSRSTGGILPIFHGDDTDFFWADNWVGIADNIATMFVTNFQPDIGMGLVTDDPIWSYNSSTGWLPFSYSPDATINTTNLQPLTVTRTGTNGTIITNYVQSCRIIIQFKNRLLLLNTIENNAFGATQYNTADRPNTGITPATYVNSTKTSFRNRARYSHNGSPFAENAFLEPNFQYQPSVGATLLSADGGGYIDAATDEEIVSAEFIKDRLIVYFSRSTWEIVYTGNDVQPFIWQKINTELGSESTFSTVPFDKEVLTIGNTGVHACNGTNVIRIDDKIPQKVFEIKDRAEGVKRVAGIRDYYEEMVYWTFPSDIANFQGYPNRVLVYNYKNGAWAFNDDCITAFGYFEQQDGMTWASTSLTWAEAEFAWNSGTVEAQFRQVLAGNHQGFVFIIDTTVPRNERAMQLTDIVYGVGQTFLVIIDHSLRKGDFITIENASGITPTDMFVVTVDDVVDEDTVRVTGPVLPSGTYAGGGNCARVSNINILSKQWNPYLKGASNFHLAQIDFYVQRTGRGEITVDYFPSASNASMLTDGGATGTGAVMGTGILETYPYDLVPLEQDQDRLWHPLYFQTTGECIQIRMYFTDDQMFITERTVNGQTYAGPAFTNFELDALILHTQRAGSRLQ